MTGMVDVLQSLAIFAGGLVLRVAAVVLMMLVLVVPAVLAIGGWHALRDLGRRFQGLRRHGRLAYRRTVRHTATHTWVDAPRGGVVRVGMDDVARRLFPSPTRVTTVAVGTRLHAGDPVASIVAGGREASVAAPVDGVLRAVNTRLAGSPTLVAEDPYFGGWLVEMEPEPVSLLRMKVVEQPGRWLARELRRFDGLVEHELGMAAADGGTPHRPALELLTDDQWARVAASLLAPGADS